MASRTADDLSQASAEHRGSGLARPLRLSSPRGPVTAALAVVLHSPVDQPPIVSDLPAQVERAIGASPDVLVDGDLQLALFWLDELHHGTIDEVDARWAGHAALLACRASIEQAVEYALRERVVVPTAPSVRDAESVAEALASAMVEGGESRLIPFVRDEATEVQLRELLICESIDTLAVGHAPGADNPRGADTPGISDDPRKAVASWMSERAAAAFDAAGLDPEYGRYVDVVDARVLAALNTVSLFGMHHRLRGAHRGYLAAYEVASVPRAQSIAEGLRRLGFAPEVSEYYDERSSAEVGAGAGAPIHAAQVQLAARELLAELIDDDAELIADVLFGAAACRAVMGWADEHVLAAWTDERSALRTPPRTHRALLPGPKKRIPSKRRLVRDSV